MSVFWVETEFRRGCLTPVIVPEAVIEVAVDGLLLSRRPSFARRLAVLCHEKYG